MPKIKKKYKSVFLSDIHLGTVHSKAKEVNYFLDHIEMDQLFLNGDIIDCWSLKRKIHWTSQHTRFLRKVLKRIEKKRTQVIYLRGNHDDLLEKFLPIELKGLSFVKEYRYSTPKGDYLVTHGDVFDVVTKNHKWLSIFGDIGYQKLMTINRLYNWYRRKVGKDYFSLSQYVKNCVKSAVNHISKFEEHLAERAETENCIGVIVGHIHCAANKYIQGIHYLNSGDWVESMTALVENLDGSWEIIEFQNFYEEIKSLKEDFGEDCIKSDDESENDLEVLLTT
jgi:UDP-2,3-diacylglucosamine pyrophosphatase LpxH